MKARVSGLAVLIAAGAFCGNLAGAAPSEWFVARSPHFEVYSQTGADHCKEIVTRFEELRSFFNQNRLFQVQLGSKERPPLRVIEFSSQKEYDAFKVSAIADAYYTGTADRDYIVMPASAGGHFDVAAHEYAHSVLHSRGLKLPAWLNEGIAELFSTVTIIKGHSTFGGPLAARVDILRRHAWLPAAQLLAGEPGSQLRDSRSGAAIFYAESWALTELLASSPDYAAHFGDLIEILNQSETSSQQAFAKVYGKSLDAILNDAKNWVAHSKSSRRTFSFMPDAFSLDVTSISPTQAQAIQADLLFANGQLNAAQQIYKQLLDRSPSDPDLLGSLGTVALRQGKRGQAVEYFREALDHKLQNVTVCYRYALVADEMDLPRAEIERALLQTIALQPDLNDARYRLALLKSNAGEFQEAVNQLKAMTKPAGLRAFEYWSTLSYSLSELDKRDEAESAAKEALQYAVTPQERARAADLAYVAQTDLTVRFIRGADGTLQLATARVRHGTTDFNPFVEPGDRLQVAMGTLREIQCKEGRLTGLLVESTTEVLTLSIPDPLHVLIRNGPSTFFCGPQPAANVQVEFAATSESHSGLLRGMRFQ